MASGLYRCHGTRQQVALGFREQFAEVGTGGCYDSPGAQHDLVSHCNVLLGGPIWEDCVLIIRSLLGVDVFDSGLSLSRHECFV